MQSVVDGIGVGNQIGWHFVDGKGRLAIEQEDTRNDIIINKVIIDVVLISELNATKYALLNISQHNYSMGEVSVGEVNMGGVNVDKLSVMTFAMCTGWLSVSEVNIRLVEWHVWIELKNW